MTGFNLEDSASHNLTVQEIVIRMIDFEDETSSNLYYQTVLDRRVNKFQQEHERAVEQGNVPEELQVALDHARRDYRNALRFNRELYTAAEEIAQGLQHPPLVLISRWYTEGIIAFTIYSAYHWAKAHGKEVPEWAPPTIESPEARQPKDAVAIAWTGTEVIFRAANKIAINFTDGRSISKDLEGTRLLNKRTKELNIVGAALLGLASRAAIQKRGPDSQEGISKKVMSNLRTALIELTGIDSDPFYDYNTADGWKPRFRVHNRICAADERAKERARHVSYEDEIHGARSTEEFPYEDDLEDGASEFLQSCHDR